ncbi:COX assembly mitochondrial protein 2 [Yarrowia sp. C11]|nr:COX assembly mitochondrial protein 2 [Yarrowia sp. C11]KAG5364262.1 COX assembly mitochondrial protein 2 [Yarrowia sp. E02]
MHPQVQEERFKSCEPLIMALDECHREDFVPRAFGLCNEVKQQLTLCLRAARIEHASQNRAKATEKQKLFAEKTRRMDEEAYGPNKILLDILAREKDGKSSLPRYETPVVAAPVEQAE